MQELNKRIKNLTIEQRELLNRKLKSMRKKSVKPNFILTLQQGNPGLKLPVYCLHPPLGAAAYYQNIGRHVHPDQPFYGIQSPAFTGEHTPFDYMEEMAKYYIEAIGRFQPTGAYCLAGHSSGAYIAYEMAVQLEFLKKDMPLLTVIDAEAPLGVLPPIMEAFETEDVYDNVNALFVSAWCVSLAHNKPLTFTLDDLAPLDREERYKIVTKYLTEAGFIPQTANNDMCRVILQMLYNHTLADKHYLKKNSPNGASNPFHGKTLILRCTEETRWPGFDFVTPSDTSEYSNWDQFCVGPITVVNIPNTDHITIIAEPAVKNIADTLQTHIDRLGKP